MLKYKIKNKLQNDNLILISNFFNMLGYNPGEFG